MWKLTILCFSLVLITNGQEKLKSYEGYKTYRIYPETDDHRYILHLLDKSTDYDFWTALSPGAKPVDVMVPPDRVNFFQKFLENNNFNFTVIVENVEEIMPSSQISTRLEDVTPLGTISFDRFESYRTMRYYMRNLDETFEHVTMFNMGRTYKGRYQYGVKISNGDPGNPAIFVDGGIHAREWLAPAQVLYIIHQLAENSSNAYLYRHVDWYILPCFNPDGYQYTREVDRLWRKTLSPGQKCKGADPNRNFDFHWNEIGASSDECDITYAGSRPFSERETRNFKRFVETIDNIKLYLTFHTYGNLILYPWGFTKELPKNHREIQRLAEKANNAIKKHRGETYEIGSSTNVLYPAAGGSDDWMMGVMGVPFAYCIELPGGGKSGFDPPPEIIRDVVTEMWDGVKVMAKYIRKKYGNDYKK